MRPRVTVDRVARTGAELADEVGFEQLTVAEVARRLDVQVASLYSHVDGLADLRARVSCLALEELAARTSDALAGRSGPEALRALGDVYRDYAVTHPGRYDAARSPLEPEVAAASAGPRLATLMRAVLHGYRLDEPDETHAVRLLGSLVHGFVSLERSGAFSHSSPGSEESWDRILGGLDAMLGAWRR